MAPLAGTGTWRGEAPSGTLVSAGTTERPARKSRMVSTISWQIA